MSGLVPRIGLALLSLAPVVTQGQPVEFERVPFSPPGATVVFHDSRGFVWMGTADALLRHEGVRITAYRHAEDDPETISGGIVEAVTERSDSSIWVGTRQGLNRIDPETGAVRRFEHDPDDPQSLPHHRVLSLFEDRSGRFWVGTAAGLGLLGDDGRFARFLDDPADPTAPGGASVGAIAEDAAGRIWLGLWRGGGVVRIDDPSSPPIRYPVVQPSYPTALVAVADSLQRTDAIAAIAPAGNRADEMRTFDLDVPATVAIVAAGEYLTAPEDWGWVEDEEGRVLWNGAEARSAHGGGAVKNRLHIDVVDLSAGRYRLRYVSDPVHSSAGWNAAAPDRPAWWGIRLYGIDAGTAGTIRSLKDQRILRDDAIPGNVSDIVVLGGDVWFGGNGLSRLDGSTGRIEHGVAGFGPVEITEQDWIGGVAATANRLIVAGGTKEPGGWVYEVDPVSGVRRPLFEVPAAAGASVRDVATDGRRGIWISVAGDGVYRSRVRRPTFHLVPTSSEVAAIESFGAGRLLLAMHDGLAVGTLPDPGDDFDLEPLPVPDARGVHRMLVDSSGTVWLGSSEGLFRWREGRTTHFLPDPTDPVGSLRGHDVRGIVPGGAGAVWVATGDPNWDAGLTRFRSDGIDAHRFDPDDSSGLGGAFISSLFRDGGGNIWLGHSRGVDRVDPAGPAFDHHPLPSMTGVVAMADGPDGTLFVGDQLGHVARYDPRSRTLRDLGIDPVTVSSVAALLTDATAGVWTAYASGALLRIDAETGIVRTYGPGDGLPSTEFVQSAALRLPDGRLLFGATDGVLVVHPAGVDSRPEQPNVVVTAVVVSDSDRYRYGLRAPGSIRVSERLDDIVLRYAVLGADGPMMVHHMLEGWERSWRPAGGRFEAHYSGLKPGTYQFRVRAVDVSGTSVGYSAPLTIMVRPVPWNRAWVRGFALLGVVASVVVVLRIRAQRRRAMDRLRLRIASDLHDDVASKVASIGLMSQIARRGSTEERLDELARIEAASKEIVGSLRDIVWFIDPDHDEAGAFVGRLRSTAEEIVNGRDLTFRVPDPSCLDALTIGAKRDLYLVLREATYNAVRHGDPGRIRIAIECDDTDLTMTIEDDGSGFSASDVVDGFGMESMRRRAERLGGRIDLSSEPGVGTTVRVRLPATPGRGRTRNRYRHGA